MTREEAIRRIRAWNLDSDDREVLAVIIPELRESEDERIRKELIEALKTSKTVGELKFRLPAPTREECIAYLEKQKDFKWSPSEDEMGVLYKLCYISNQVTDEDDTNLTRLYQDLKREYFNGHSFENMFPSEKQKESLHTSETCKENANSFTDEDEKIRKALINIVKGACGKYGIKCRADKVTEEKLFSYLEKQKDLDKMIVISPEVWDKAINDAYENGKKDNEKQKEQKLVDLSEMMVHKEPYIAPVPTPMVADEQRPAEWSEKRIADIFEKVGLAKIAREQGNDELTNAIQDAMLELSKLM